MILYFTGYRDSIMRTQIQAFHDEAFQLFVTKYPHFNNLENLKLVVDLNYNMRSRAGTASLKKMTIQLNYRLHIKNRDALIKTYVHELAHILVGLTIKQKVAPHGKEWAKYMKVLGQKPETTHTMDTSELKRSHKKFKIYCECSTYEVGIRRYQRILNAENLGKDSPLRCRTCKQGVYTRKENTISA